MSSTLTKGSMEQCHITSCRHEDSDFSLKEWALKARISRENTHSRRFSASNLRSFREDPVSSIAISSTASSPGYYTARDEINPSTYSFTTALKALQAKTVYSWEYIPTDGVATLSSKWNDAEKYISNPLSGEVPLECLSAKTLSGRTFRNVASRITMTAPLICPSHLQQFYAKSPIIELEDETKLAIQERQQRTTTDVGTQSTPVEVSSSSPSPAPTPSIEERSIKHGDGGDSSVCFSENSKSEAEVEGKETRDKQYTEGNEAAETKKLRKQIMCIMCNSGSQGAVGCLSIISLKGLWMRTKTKKGRRINEEKQ
ncbi:hypothetical protein F511_23790 [Dorcoceras hygrometricum]|uniref:Uncharacterized protein n=1 Tax=Dorcoceras hygrometricum TaxID=472368 RepID=A0A2Z7AD16_9LAMI|nr:hypothetical protein F511_23790 [Dorcoceras hygrometricum]